MISCTFFSSFMNVLLIRLGLNKILCFYENFNNINFNIHDTLGYSYSYVSNKDRIIAGKTQVTPINKSHRLHEEHHLSLSSSKSNPLD